MFESLCEVILSVAAYEKSINLTNAQNALFLLHVYTISNNIREFILVKNLINAKCAVYLYLGPFI
jgi:transcriptional regulator with AAA-type ATPase domain